MHLPAEHHQRFRAFLQSRGFAFEDREHQVFLARQPGATVNLYKSGAVVIGGSDALLLSELDFFLKEYGSPEDPKKELPPLVFRGNRIGTDEVGKGDYFGPLVVAGAFVTEPQAEKLKAIGVRDSKKLSETSISNLAVAIKKILFKDQIEVITISPIKYNLMYAERRNVNKILGWAHARALERVLEFPEACEQAIADQFGDTSYIQDVLDRKGVRIDLLQTPKAEREVSVAAASVIARDQFLKHMEEMGKEYDLVFPRGSSAVEGFAKTLVAKFGSGVLLATAKVHFVTTTRVLDDSASLDDALGEVRAAERERAPVGSESASHWFLEVFSLLSSFEQDFRAFLKSMLQKAHGEEWWERGVPKGIRATAQELRLKEAKRGHNAELIDCLSFADYDAIIREKDNWESIFRQVFEDPEILHVRLRMLADIRNPVAHSRSFTRHDKLTALGTIGWLRQKISDHEAKTRDR